LTFKEFKSQGKVFRNHTSTVLMPFIHESGMLWITLVVDPEQEDTYARGIRRMFAVLQAVAGRSAADRSVGF
jgi:hypothetical protein